MLLEVRLYQKSGGMCEKRLNMVPFAGMRLSVLLLQLAAENPDLELGPAGHEIYNCCAMEGSRILRANDDISACGHIMIVPFNDGG